MADALVKIALEQLKVGIQDEYGLLVGAKKEVEKLQSTFTAIRAVISDAERRQLKEESVKDWLRKLKDVAYDVDDVLDEWTTSSSSFLRDQGNDNKVCSPLASPGRFLIQLQFRHRVGRRIREINGRLDQISSEKDRYGFREVNMEEKEKRETSSLVDEQGIFGREKEKEDLISKLISENSHTKKDVPIISIVGMGGIGKTALAQIVFNDNRVKDHFALRIWLCVANDFKINELTRKVLESAFFAIGSRYEGPSDMDSMQSHLCELVSTKRFLVVLDDVWNEESEKWEQWSLPLRKGAQGSRIVVTTRIHKVSRMMGTVYTHDLQALSDDDCWRVFTSKAFSGRTNEECLELEEIGRKIIRKCDGLPLAAKTIGSVMRFKRRKQDWVSLSGSEMWDVQGGPLPALLISYDNLPSHLKPCFLYCSVFGKDERIVKNDLIKLWMAQGFIMTQRGKHIEDIGGEYFDDLIDRSLFQDVEKDSDENVTHCKMHDLVHDLVRLVANEEYFVPDSQGQILSPMNARHLSYISINWVKSIPSHLYYASNLRTLLSFNLGEKAIPQILFDHLRCLRTLDLSRSNIETLPSSIKHLKHLRYFDLSKTYLRKLPKQVSSLCNLQTLKLNDCSRLCKLPKGLTRMASLQHLEIERTDRLTYTPKGIGEMRSLRALSRFIVGTEHGYGNIGELKSLNLHGKLEIRHLERVSSEDEAKSVELAKKRYLKSLTLHCQSMEGEEKIEGIFESLNPSHENLQMLEIRGYYGSKIPSWMQEMSLFGKLIEVRLFKCTNFKQLPSLGILPFLKDLKISKNSEIERVGHEFIGDAAVAFPKLEKLEFRAMYKWKEWEMRSLENEQQIIMPCLLQLRITNCSKLKSWPELGKLPSLEYLTVNENKAVERVGHVLYGHCDGDDGAKGIAFPKLKELVFYRMSKWEDWELRVENVQIIMPSLLCLTILKCPKLKSLPEFLPAKLVTLRIEYCDEIVWMTSQFHHVLRECNLYGCKRLLSMSSLPCLTNLEKLVISDTITLPHNGWEQLESLHTLNFIYCCQLTSLPNKLGQLKSLHTLNIHGCPELESLPTSIGQLKSLQELSIKYCKQLRSFPDDLTQLQSLHTLCIMGCFQLRVVLCHQPKHFNCGMPSSPVASKVGGGEDWHKIKHIPNIIIGDEIIQSEKDGRN